MPENEKLHAKKKTNHVQNYKLEYIVKVFPGGHFKGMRKFLEALDFFCLREYSSYFSPTVPFLYDRRQCIFSGTSL